MKIEKISDNQIRCTLTREDLENHQIRLSEIAYGSEKAKKLFRDMMQQASIQFGFEADNIPLMIEAIPVNSESIILIITKVEDPEELDTRFSKFAPFKENTGETLQLDGADNIIDIFQKIYEAKMKASSKKAAPKAKDSKKAPEETPSVNLIRLFTFSSLDDVIAASHSLNGFFTGANSLYKDRFSENYQLVIHQSDQTPEVFNKVCNILSEYGTGRAFTAAGEAHLLEHGYLIAQDAFSTLTQL
ncbi:MAG TPA: adaptor protein MecA [Candidatus Blautia faecigallinarum]|uniref:Adaptor protein MecA n=1 Tax=Candidatus Blautia faecigallinarum TaxID=2838488 RepID=A0A9D2DS71_9FIRM|nr:adaptor protein MecA [Candidatus Blautia faecigallinarum]